MGKYIKIELKYVKYPYFLTPILLKPKKNESEYKQNYTSANERVKYAKSSQQLSENQASASTSKTKLIQKSVELTDKDVTFPASSTTSLIHKVIFNDKFAHLHPTKQSDFVINYVQPEKSAYRKKRTVLLYPAKSSCHDVNAYESEYKQKYSS